MKATLVGLGLLTVVLVQPVIAASVTIADIPTPEYTEVELVKDGSLLTASEIKGLKYPIKAETEGKDSLAFRVTSENYRISRSDVTLTNEKLIVDACRTVPVSIANDARSASVKGAGEGCK